MHIDIIDIDGRIICRSSKRGHG